MKGASQFLAGRSCHMGFVQRGAVLDCGGMRSATPLSRGGVVRLIFPHRSAPSQSGVPAAAVQRIFMGAISYRKHAISRREFP